MPLSDPRSILVLSDVHLGPHARPDVSDALCALIEQHSHAELLFAGDVFEFSSLTDAAADRAWQRLCAANPEVIVALRTHVARGGKLTFLAGNHDAALSSIAGEVAATFGPGEAVVLPWFARRGDVHIEHGHLWDRDNAPLHPLSDWSSPAEPLGIALMRRFVTARRAAAFAHAHQTTPLAGLQRTLRMFGLRAPLVIIQYFATAIALCCEAATTRREQARQAQAQGDLRLLQLAESSALDAEKLRGILRSAPRPTHLSARTTFMRLYFDRILTLFGATLGLLLVLFGSHWAWGAVAALCAGYLLASARQGSRYPSPVLALEQGAFVVSRALAARVVLFGHSHVEQQTEHYVNLGSFGYGGPQGRPFALVEQGQRVVLCHWPHTSRAPVLASEQAQVPAQRAAALPGS